MKQSKTLFYNLSSMLNIVKNESPFCFKMMLSYILNLIGNKKMQLTWIFRCFVKLNDQDFQWKKNKMLQLTRSKVMPLTCEREIAADNGMWVTHSSHLELVLNCQKRGQAQRSSSRAVAKILNLLNKWNFVADVTLSMRKWGLHEIFKLLYRLMLMRS